ncbi:MULTISPECIES: 23S rRNA (pseudouridine(1915)-N(3))-methyltransferase RlmH [unclassified Sphingobium]|uniref:23S rRNA (pseudouridine(1915)-N(3))-methyltransferase RlmH n=1 Tax=unclassified Sphingobium TaxID=2611147 RepID=UPI002225A346|nr:MULTISPECIES: 23S rRNA (pseudouridine(1915)-N(3))-methyltransferase RlmH [unclassified Sphingobium]MCW2351173.1 23S rRNA (pseudouridine1915-N3)-methyltransferase [Sphingobium sp. B12D2B]MCW2370393.1 23S rRNA (pseudouridine1915-N3)-methyltransferase [Sphingobium sp. B11D3D]
MLLHIVARGRIGRSPEADLVERYLKRVTLPAKVTELPDRGGKAPPPLPAQSVMVMLDETGKQLTSMAFAEQIGRWRDDGVRECRFMIGAADGFETADRASADLLIAFGAMTWPHMMARAMLAEQLWRATSILANHPYHREG